MVSDNSQPLSFPTARSVRAQQKGTLLRWGQVALTRHWPTHGSSTDRLGSPRCARFHAYLPTLANTKTRAGSGLRTARAGALDTLPDARAVPRRRGPSPGRPSPHTTASTGHLARGRHPCGRGWAGGPRGCETQNPEGRRWQSMLAGQHHPPLPSCSCFLRAACGDQSRHVTRGGKRNRNGAVNSAVGVFTALAAGCQ